MFPHWPATQHQTQSSFVRELYFNFTTKPTQKVPAIKPSSLSNFTRQKKFFFHLFNQSVISLTSVAERFKRQLFEREQGEIISTPSGSTFIKLLVGPRHLAPSPQKGDVTYIYMGQFTRKCRIFYIHKSYKNDSRLNRYNFRTVNTIHLLF